MTIKEVEPQDWHDAALEVCYRYDMLAVAKTLPEQATQLAELSNAISDLKSWLPGWDGEYGTMPWDRDEE